MDVEPTKMCRRCSTVRPLTRFRKNRRICRDCECKAAREDHHRKQQKDPAYRAMRLRNAQAWTAAHPGAQRDHNLKRFNITAAECDEMLENQGGGCAVCGKPPGRRMHDVDHDHICCPGNYSCGECLRGLLCNDCNMGIGKFFDDPDLLFAAAEYVLKWRRRLD